MNAIHRLATAAALLSTFALPAQAASTSFLLDWSGSIFSNNAEAHGILTVDDALFPNNSIGGFLVPGLEITGLTLTVTGASVGNGSFSLTDYAGFIWDTKGSSLDFSRELVGQSIDGGEWGKGYDTGGDFSLLANEGSSAPNTSGWYFRLATANGSGDLLKLTSFRPETLQPVPLPSAFWVFASVCGLICGNLRRVRSNFYPAA
ncbi:hypothetical protein ACH50O_03680 [Methylomonas sp. 2BW1-5-20]|uniref:hypothetical protein n=1 Tax=Methylomonas sp. 2BW1-5-20 TaxID=3376686 RepID=UPI00404C05DB